MFLGVSRIEQAVDTVRLVGMRRGRPEESVVAAGRYDPETGRFSLPLNGNIFEFSRETVHRVTCAARSLPLRFKDRGVAVASDLMKLCTKYLEAVPAERRYYLWNLHAALYQPDL